MGIPRPSITRLTHELVEMGCVEQKQLEEDRRVFLVELTAKGKNLRLLCPPIPQWFNEQLAQVSPSDLEAAIRVIHQAASVMEQVPEQFEQAKKGGNAVWKMKGLAFVRRADARLFLSILAAGLLSFTGVVIETAMNVTFPTLMEEFSVDTSTVQWLTTGYLLVLAR